jgi:hypothetical protein
MIIHLLLIEPLTCRDNLHNACIKSTEGDNGAALDAPDSAAAALEEAFLSTDAALLEK